MPVERPKSFRCEILSWATVVRDTKKLASLIRGTGYRPDIVVAIGRGGYVPARLLCDYLFLKDLTSMKVEHWTEAGRPKEEALVRFPLCADITDKSVLLVDDITDTGETIRVSLEYLYGFKPKEIRTAVVIHKKTSQTIPDYFARRVIRWRWVIFPWHIWEDLAYFTSMIRADGYQTEAEILLELKKRYDLSIKPELIREVMGGTGGHSL